MGFDRYETCQKTNDCERNLSHIILIGNKMVYSFCGNPNNFLSI